MIKSNGMVAAASPRGWVRSSRCTPNTNCMEVCLAEETVGIRDSKCTGVGNLIFPRPQWVDFLAMITS